LYIPWRRIRIGHSCSPPRVWRASRGATPAKRPWSRSLRETAPASEKINRSHAHAHDSRTNHYTERATAQRRFIVEVIVAALKLPPSAALLLSSLLAPAGEKTLRYVYVYTCICIYICIYIHVYIYIHTHTHACKKALEPLVARKSTCE